MSGRRRVTREEALASLTPAQRAELDAFTEEIGGKPREELVEIVAVLIAEAAQAELTYRARWS